MRYSVYFEKVRDIADTNPQLAESLLREAESYASQVVPEHLVLCARGWEHDLHNHDNAVRSMLEPNAAPETATCTCIWPHRISNTSAL